MATIEIDHVTKVFGSDVVAVDDVTLTIQDGEFLVLVGPSGCGKSTLLRMLAGLEEVTAGTIRIDGVDVTDLAPRHRDIAMVFQNYALYPHMSVRENLGYGLKVRRAPKAESRQRVAEVAELLGLEELLDRRPAQLSGGQRQRVAMGRAIVRQPRAFLMDEPLSNLDAKLRVGMRASLAQLHARLGVTTVYVTHDQTEAMTLGERVAVLRDGAVVQVDRPQELYAHPRDVFVAAFIGAPSMNLVHATVEEGAVRLGQYVLPLDAACRPDSAGPVVVGVRPEAFADATTAPPDLPRIDVDVEVVEELGADTHV
jgi:multiple sugar transport system ATP-binding protein